MHTTRLRLLPALLGLLVAGGCATTQPGPDVGAADVPRLEAAHEADPDDVGVLTRLGVAYFRAGEHQAAAETLDEAIETGSASGTAYLFLGLANEELGEWAAARDAYAAYLQVADDPEMAERIRGRQALVGRRALQAEARNALAREAELSQADPTPRSAAVFPFRLFTDDPELEPLGVALADMMTTDLQLSGGIVVLERTQVQTLIDEMDLTEAGFTEEATGARAGRLLRAEHVVQGALTTLEEELLRMDADVLATERAASIGEAEEQDLLEMLFDMEKEIVLQVIDILGVDLTPAEREAINENRAENLLAFLAYGRGLMAMDEGNFGEAQQHFQQAAQLDPSFAPAQEKAAEAETLETADASTPSETGDQAGGDGSTTTADAGGTDDMMGDMTTSVNGTGADHALGGGPTGGDDNQATDRDPTSEATGDEGDPSPTATVTVEIPNPGNTGGGQ